MRNIKLVARTCFKCYDYKYEICILGNSILESDKKAAVWLRKKCVEKLF